MIIDFGFRSIIFYSFLLQRRYIVYDLTYDDDSSLFMLLTICLFFSCSFSSCFDEQNLQIDIFTLKTNLSFFQEIDNIFYFQFELSININEVIHRR